MAGASDAVTRMLNAQSVAVVGASPREGTAGNRVLDLLVNRRYRGRVYPVNPRYEELAGLRCYPSIADLPEPVDLAALIVSNQRIEEQLAAAVAAGARSAVVYASGYDADNQLHPSGMTLRDRLAAIAREAGLAVCGGNCMGFLNFDNGLLPALSSEPYAPLADDTPGNITFVSHSGSVYWAFTNNRRQLRFNLSISAGQELVTTAADYVHYALDLPTTRAIALFLETVRNPAGFRLALERAAREDIPVVVLKVGRLAESRAMVAAHSGALAGEDGAYEALFAAYGVLRVETLDEMADTLELLTRGRRAPSGGLAAVHDSGGERSLLIDCAAAAKVPLARICRETEHRLSSYLDPWLPPVNPLDAWSTADDFQTTFASCMEILLDDPATAALALCVDGTRQDPREESFLQVAVDVWNKIDKPLAMLSNMQGAVDESDAAWLRERGVPYLEGTMSGLAAFRHLFAYRDFRSLPPCVPPDPVSSTVSERWRRRLRSGGALGELEGLALLRDYGIPTVCAHPAATLDEALCAARASGWPVALKTAVPSVQHKSDVGGVRLGLADETAVAAAYADLATQLGPEVVVQAMAPAGVELALGMLRDAQFGPLVMVAAGGILVELLRDRRFALPPLDAVRARRLLDELAIRPILDGARGAPPVDIASVIDAIVRMSALAYDLGKMLEALDVNPLIVGPGGCVAVDTLVIARGDA